MGGDRLVTTPDLADVSARFASLLHAAGVPVTPDRAGLLATTLALTPPVTTTDLYWLGRVVLVTDKESIGTFDAVFKQVFEGFVDPADARGQTPPPELPRRTQPNRNQSEPLTAATPPGAMAPAVPTDDQSSEAEADTVATTASSEERLRHKDFSKLTTEELSQLRSLTLVPPMRLGRRNVADKRGKELDIRATLRRSRRTGGEPVDAIRRHRRARPRKVVFLCDISGSMEPYARAYLELLGKSVTETKAEAFVFATRLTRLTKAITVRNPDLALERAGKLAPDWSGGTRIGAALKAFNDGYGRRGLARGAVVLILSDGWDTDDPEVLGREMERLSRLAFQIVWVNPRKAAPGFRPVVGGMAAALPYVDTFVSGHSLAALGEVLAAIATGVPAGYFDRRTTTPSS